eukprot:9473953-Pyramimonas_sp.AAC.1
MVTSAWFLASLAFAAGVLEGACAGSRLRGISTEGCRPSPSGAPSAPGWLQPNCEKGPTSGSSSADLKTAPSATEGDLPKLLMTASAR